MTITHREGLGRNLTAAEVDANFDALVAADAAEVTARNAAITTAVNALVNGAPGALNTLKELADAMADDAAFATTVTNALAQKAPLSQALTITNLLGLMTDAGNVVATQTAGQLRFDLNFNFVVSNPNAIPNVDGALLTRVSAPFQSVLTRLTALEGGSGITATHFRILITAGGSGNGANFPGLAEVEFHASVGGAQIASSGNCTVSATSLANSTTWAASNLLDGAIDEDHSWIGYGSDIPITLDFVFSSPVLVREITLKSQSGTDGGYGAGFNRSPSAFKLQHIATDGTTVVTDRTLTAVTWGADGASFANAYQIN